MAYNPDLDQIRTRRGKKRSSFRQTIRRWADLLSLWLLNFHFFDRAVEFLTYQRKRLLRRRAESRLREKGLYGDKIESGPFKGLEYPPHNEMWVSERFEKINGIYEIELFDVIERLAHKNPGITQVINIGAAEGFYSIGLARILAGVPAIAFEAKPQAREAMLQIAKLNDVDSLLTIKGDCTPETLANLEVGNTPFVVCDVDGYELEIMDSEKVPWLSRAYILLELHDVDISGITATMRRRFENSHHIEHLPMTGFSYADHPVFRELTFSEIHALAASDRPGLQDWFVMSPLDKAVL